MIKLRGNHVTQDPRLDCIPTSTETHRVTMKRFAKELVTRTWDVPIHLDQGREGACFPPGTFVRMANGTQKRIESVGLLDVVATAEGRTGCVLQTMARRHTGVISNVKLRGHHLLRCTLEHPLLTKRGYVAAKDLIEDDYVAVTRYMPPSHDVLVVDPSIVCHGRARAQEVNTGGVISKISPLPSTIALDAKFGRILGLYAAEGHTTVNKVVWSFGGTRKTPLLPN